MALAVGTRVRIHSLLNKPELNGRAGVVICALDESTGRVGVDISSKVVQHAPVALKPVNLEIMHDADAGMHALSLETQ